MNNPVKIHSLLIACSILLYGCDGGISGTGFGDDEPTVVSPPIEFTPIFDYFRPLNLDPFISEDDPVLPFSELFGSANFVYGFTEEEELFSFVTLIDQNNLVSEDRVTYLQGSGELSRRTTTDGENEQLGQMPYACIRINGGDDDQRRPTKYVCLVQWEENESLAYFEFEYSASGEFFGDFEFCDLMNEAPSACLYELENSPDGSVSVTIEPINGKGL